MPTITAGILKAFNSSTYLAIVQLSGSLQNYVEGVPVNRGIPSAEMTTGRKVAIAFIDPANPKDAVLFAVWT